MKDYSIESPFADSPPNEAYLKQNSTHTHMKKISIENPHPPDPPDKKEALKLGGKEGNVSVPGENMNTTEYNSVVPGLQFGKPLPSAVDWRIIVPGVGSCVIPRRRDGRAATFRGLERIEKQASVGLRLAFLDHAGVGRVWFENKRNRFKLLGHGDVYVCHESAYRAGELESDCIRRCEGGSE